MEDLKKIAGINLLILLVYSLLFALMLNLKDVSYLPVVFICMAICFQVFVNLVLAIVFFIKKDKNKGFGFLLSILLVLIIGLSSCFGIGSML